MDAGFDKADERMDAEIREVRGDMRSLRKELLAAAVIIIAALLGLVAASIF